MKELARRPDAELQIIAFGPHLSPEFGCTVEEIERDGLSVHERIECLLSSDTDTGMAKTIGLATLSLADVLGKMRPDILVVTADRYEMLAAASVALALRIPLAHIEGGEVTEGAIDDAVRNALTKMSHLHFTTTEAARRRVVALGEEQWRVHPTGALSLDGLRARPLLSRERVEAELNIKLSMEAVLVCYHPVTLEPDTTAEADAVFEALSKLPQQIIFSFPNADAGSRALIERARAFCLKADAGARHLFVNLGALRYWSLMNQVGLVLGNSSSGMMETASLEKPTVNIGKRQQGREHGRNVLHAEADAASILQQVERALEPAFAQSLKGMRNPYGEGGAATKIASLLLSAPLGEKLLMKRAAQEF